MLIKIIKLLENCPPNFVFINNECYRFQQKALSWNESIQACAAVDAILLDLHNIDEIKGVFWHLTKARMSHLFEKMHSKFPPPDQHLNSTFEKIFFYRDNFKFCHKLNNQSHSVKSKFSLRIKHKTNHLVSQHSKAAYFDEEIYSYFNANNIADLHERCAMIEYFSPIKLRKNVSFCIMLNECDLLLPSICKLKQSNKKFYKNTLEGYQQDPKMSYLINSFLAVVYGLNIAHQKASFY